MINLFKSVSIAILAVLLAARCSLLVVEVPGCQAHRDFYLQIFQKSQYIM